MTDKELNDMVYSDNPWERRTAAMNGYGLDILVHDKAPMVRVEVARQGYRPDILVHDNDWFVRRGVAESGNCLDILITMTMTMFAAQLLELAIRRGNCYEIMIVK